jgi:hypothetical protein
MNCAWHHNTYMEKRCGAMVFVDEYGTAFWSKLDYVLLAPTHPVFAARRTYGALTELHQERADQLEWAGSDDALRRQPIKVSKAVYEAAKFIFRD